MKTNKIASIVLLIIFSFQQVSWAGGYNLSLLLNPPPSPLIYKDHGEFNRWVAKRVYSLAKPSFRHNPQELKSAYQWLKQPATETVPCSAYVLYNLLQAKGIKPKIEDISAFLISHDLKAGNLKPPFTQNKIYNSLYSLAKTAESQGLTLYPARLNSITPQFLNSQTPFIAHLSYAGQSGHFVLVTKIDTQKVYFLYDKGDTFLPYEKFLEEFSGYCLLSSISSVGTEHYSVPTISDSEAKSILGAGRAYHGRSVNISSLFKKPSSIESVIGIASSIGGAFFMPSGNLWATAAGAGIQVGGGLLFKDSMWGRIATGVAAGAVSGGLSGGGSGWHGLSWGWQTAGIGAAKGFGMSATMEGIKAMNFGDASLRASIANLVAIPVGQAIEGGLSAKFGAKIDGMDYSKAKGSFWKGAWVGVTFQGSVGKDVSGWKKWAPAIAYYGGQSASIAVEAFGPKKYSSLYSTGISTAFNALTNVAAMGQGDKLWKVLGKSVAAGALRGGLSIGLQKLTKDMRITEGAFLEMAGASLISAGVESAFGKWSGDDAVSRKGIFWDNLQKSWKGAMTDVVTFGAAKGYMLGTSGAYAFLKMSELGSNVGKARASGLSAFDSAHWAFNQHVGSTYHNAAVNTLSNMVWNRVGNVKYVYGVGGKGTEFITKITQRELNQFYRGNLSSQTSNLKNNIVKEEKSSLLQEIEKGLKINPNSLELQAARFALLEGEDMEHASNALKKYQVTEIDRKLEYQGNEGIFGKGFLSPQDTLFINNYGASAWRGEKNQQKVKLNQDISSLTAQIAARQLLSAPVNSSNMSKHLQDGATSTSTKKPWKIITRGQDVIFKMRGSISDGKVVKGEPDITSKYDPDKAKYEVVIDNDKEKTYEVDRIEDFVTVGDKKLRRVMEMGSTHFPGVEGGLPNFIPGKSMLEAIGNLENIALELKKEGKLILTPGPDPDPDPAPSQHAKGNFPLFPGYQLKPGATKAEKIPGYDEEIKGRMIYGNTKEEPAIMVKQRSGSPEVVEFNFVGDVSDVFKIKGIKVKDKKFKIEKELSPRGLVEHVDKIKWNQGARAAESLPDGRTTYTETVVKDSEIGKSWEEKTTTVLDRSIYAGGKGYKVRVEGNKLKVREDGKSNSYIEVDRIIGSTFGDLRVGQGEKGKKGKKILEYKPVQGDLIEFNYDSLKVSRQGGFTHPDVIEGADGLDMESLKYINDNIIIEQDDKQNKVYFSDDNTGEFGVEAPVELYNKKIDSKSPTAVYIVDKDNKLQPHISVKFEDGTTNIYPVSDFKGLIPKATKQDEKVTEDLIKEVISGKANYRPSKEMFMGYGYTQEQAEAMVNQGAGYDALSGLSSNGGYHSTLESAPAKTREVNLAASGIGEGGSGSKYIQGFIRNEPDTMSDVGQPIISMDKISQSPKVDLQKMSDAQYDRLLSGLEDSSQEYTMIGADAGRDYYSETTEKYKGFTRVERFDSNGKEIFGKNVYDDGSIFISGSNDSGHMWKEKDTRDVITTVSTHPDRALDYVSVSLPTKTTAKVDGTELYVLTGDKPGEAVIKNETPASQYFIDNNFSISAKNVSVHRPGGNLFQRVGGTLEFDGDGNIEDVRYVTFRKDSDDINIYYMGQEGNEYKFASLGENKYKNVMNYEIISTDSAGNILSRRPEDFKLSNSLPVGSNTVIMPHRKALDLYGFGLYGPSRKGLDVANGEWNNE